MGSDMKQNKFAKVKKYFSFVHLDLHILKLNGSVGIFVFFFYQCRSSYLDPSGADGAGIVELSYLGARRLY
jgi:hypothetical protein